MARRGDEEREREEIEQLFSDLWQVFPFARGRRGYRPQVDCYRTDEPPEMTVVVELPGVEPESVHIVATGRTVVVAGERRRPRSEGRIYQQMEIEYGPFEREVVLAADIDTAAAHATYSRGVLTIVLPLAKRRPRRVKVAIEVRTRP
ncbi:MAG TPA: Hsp20/alpha crystallin family protein [Gaiellaceae bacterium]